MCTWYCCMYSIFSSFSAADAAAAVMFLLLLLLQLLPLLLMLVLLGAFVSSYSCATRRENTQVRQDVLLVLFPVVSAGAPTKECTYPHRRFDYC